MPRGRAALCLLELGLRLSPGLVDALTCRAAGRAAGQAAAGGGGGAAEGGGGEGGGAGGARPLRSGAARTLVRALARVCCRLAA
jgi:hypothetical protein